MHAPSYSTLDDALDQIVPYGIELRNGNSNHAPMVAEALCALGRPEAVMPWIARYRQRMSPRPAAGERIRSDAWRPALGKRDRFTDWSRFFGEELSEAPWREVLDRWVGRLAPGFCAAATHGVLRVGHAARGLAAGATQPRVRELADALAGWAATWQELPAGDPIATGTMAPRRAIAEVPLVPPERRRAGNIVMALGALDGFAGFAPAIRILDTGGAVAPLVAELTEVFARVYLANARNIPTVIAFIHGVTSHAALGNIAPHVSEATARSAVRYAWQTGCGLYACYGGGTAMAENFEQPDTGPETMIDRAIGNGDEHVIKFTEACLSRYALDPSPAYLAAAHHAAGMVGRR
jgi:questin oxidase-like protein